MMKRGFKFALVGFSTVGVILQLACARTETPAPASAPSVGVTATQPVVVAFNPSLPIKADKVPLNCGEPLPSGYSATWRREIQGVGPMVDVTVRGAKPAAKAAEDALRKCLASAADKFAPDIDVFGTTWWSAAGNDDADSPVTMTDKSDHLIYSIQEKTVVGYGSYSTDRSRHTERARSPK